MRQEGYWKSEQMSSQRTEGIARKVNVLAAEHHGIKTSLRESTELRDFSICTLLQRQKHARSNNTQLNQSCYKAAESIRGDSN